MLKFSPGKSFAEELDLRDPLASFRKKFKIPRQANKRPVIYFAGNSLGLQPLGVKEALEKEVAAWADLGVKGHFEGKTPWFYYHDPFPELVAPLLGAKPSEVVLMNSLTVNLHLMMISFYRPTPKRYKILIEENTFPSDYYAVKSQLQLHGYDPESSLLIAKAPPGEKMIPMETFNSIFKTHGEEIALVLLEGVHYFTGQALDIRQITEQAHDHGALAGFDLAHAAGNLAMKLHDWNVDFAVWCNYKYLNCGPGSVGGCFIHERHTKNKNLPRLSGWWGQEVATRFDDPLEFVPEKGALGWQLSNIPIFSMAPCRVSFSIFQKAGMTALRKKSKNLTGYLEFLLTQNKSEKYAILTPRDPARRGCQLSIKVKGSAKECYKKLDQLGIVCDVRGEEVIRVAPVPLYNSFQEVWQFSKIFSDVLSRE